MFGSKDTQLLDLEYVYVKNHEERDQVITRRRVVTSLTE